MFQFADRNMKVFRGGGLWKEKKYQMKTKKLWAGLCEGSRG